MKQLFLVASLMLSVSSYAQWEMGEYVDEFGSKTGETYLYQTCLGIFSNSATINSKCLYDIEHMVSSKLIGITIYPYGRNVPESWYDDTFQTAKIKKPSGDIVSIEVFCIDGMIYLDGEEYNQFMEETKEPGEYIMALRHVTPYGESSYRFTFYN